METRKDELLSSNRIFITIVLSLFLIICTVNILNHEMWRDEMDVWMVANYNSPQAIIDHIKVQGHPALWFLVVKASQQIFPSPFGMALANLLFISLAVLVLLKYAPFNRSQKVFLSFSYFMLYEYGTISRNYGISVFFIFAACALYAHREKYTVPIAILLAISCNIHAMNLIIACSLAFLFTAEQIFPARTTSDIRIPKSHLLIGTFILIIGILLALNQVIPSKGSPWAMSSANKWLFHSPLYVLTVVWKSFIPISSPSIHFWNTNILPDGHAMILLSLFIMFASCLIFIRKPIIFSFYLLGVMTFFFFFYKIYHGFIRHHGYLFIMFVITYWLSFNYRGVKNNNLLAKLNSIVLNKKFNFFTLICFIHFIAVFIPIYFDWYYPFSASRDVARFLVKNNLQDNILLGDKDVCVAPVAGWIDREIYYPAISDYARYVIWNHPNRKSLPWKDIRNNKDYFHTIRQKAQALANEKNMDVILILNYAIDDKPLKTFTTSIVSDEVYYIYRVQPGKQRK